MEPIRVVAGAIVLVAPAIMIIRQAQRASIRGTPVQLSRLREYSCDRNGAALESNGELGCTSWACSAGPAPSTRRPAR
jgi:Zn-dependent protease with chaperone function